MFLAARAVLLSMRADEDFGCAEKLSAAAVQKKKNTTKTYFRHRLSAVVSIFTDSAASVSCLLTTPLHYNSIGLKKNCRICGNYILLSLDLLIVL